MYRSYCRLSLKISVYWHVKGPGSSVGIATDYGLNGPGIESGTQDRVFAPDRSRRIFPAEKIHSMQYDTIQTTIESPIPGQ
jgi:hypothetical protein